MFRLYATASGERKSCRLPIFRDIMSVQDFNCSKNSHILQIHLTPSSSSYSPSAPQQTQPLHTDLPSKKKKVKPEIKNSKTLRPSHCFRNRRTQGKRSRTTFLAAAAQIIFTAVRIEHSSSVHPSTPPACEPFGYEAGDGVQIVGPDI